MCSLTTVLDSGKILYISICAWLLSNIVIDVTVVQTKLSFRVVLVHRYRCIIRVV